MSFLSKIKYEYHSKHLQDLFRNQKYKELIENITKLSDKKEFFLNFAQKYIPEIFKDTNNNLLTSKIIWLNSFSDYCLDSIEKFIKFYTNEIQNKNFEIHPYENLISRNFNFYINKNEFSINDFFDHSYLYQWLILFNLSNQSLFLRNYSSFFSKQNNLNFTNINFCNCYFLIVDHPYNNYQKIKKNLNNDREIAKNIFLNSDQRPLEINLPHSKHFIPRQSWTTHTNSWSDPNVLNSLRGKIIRYDDLILNSFETLSGVIMHMIQSGINLELDYAIIEKFIDDKFLAGSEDYSQAKLSNNETKFLSSEIKEASDRIGFAV